jgi:hypothetical protein
MVRLSKVASRRQFIGAVCLLTSVSLPELSYAQAPLANAPPQIARQGRGSLVIGPRASSLTAQETVNAAMSALKLSKPPTLDTPIELSAASPVVKGLAALELYSAITAISYDSAKPSTFTFFSPSDYTTVGRLSIFDITFRASANSYLIDCSFAKSNDPVTTRFHYTAVSNKIVLAESDITVANGGHLLIGIPKIDNLPPNNHPPIFLSVAASGAYDAETTVYDCKISPVE